MNRILKTKKFKIIDEYLADYPDNIVIILNKIRTLVSELSPDAIEGISYNMPSFKLFDKPLVYFAAFQNHIGFYALPSGNDAFQKELANYKTGKGSIQFPLNKEIPYELINKIVKFRIFELTKNLNLR